MGLKLGLHLHISLSICIYIYICVVICAYMYITYVYIYMYVRRYKYIFDKQTYMFMCMSEPWCTYCPSCCKKFLSTRTRNACVLVASLCVPVYKLLRGSMLCLFARSFSYSNTATSLANWTREDFLLKQAQGAPLRSRTHDKNSGGLPWCLVQPPRLSKLLGVEFQRCPSQRVLERSPAPSALMI